MSFLSGGLKTLASKALTPTKWLRTALRRGKSANQTIADVRESTKYKFSRTELVFIFEARRSGLQVAGKRTTTT